MATATLEPFYWRNWHRSKPRGNSQPGGHTFHREAILAFTCFKIVIIVVHLRENQRFSILRRTRDLTAIYRTAVPSLCRQSSFCFSVSDLITLENNSVDKAEFSFSHQVLVPSGLLVVPNCALKKKKKKKERKEKKRGMHFLRFI